MNPRTHSALLVSMVFILTACGGSATPTPTAINTPTATAGSTTDQQVEAGEALFRSKGCSSCHGQNAEGGSGPALAGHTAEQVINQVRSPVGNMPAFDESLISNEELDQIAAFIVSLANDADSDDHHHETGDHMEETPHMH